MNIRERLIERIKELDPETALRLYDLAIEYGREREPPGAPSTRDAAMERCRLALRDFKGSLAEDVLDAREERV